MKLLVTSLFLVVTSHCMLFAQTSCPLTLADFTQAKLWGGERIAIRAERGTSNVTWRAWARLDPLSDDWTEITPISKVNRQITSENRVRYTAKVTVVNNSEWYLLQLTCKPITINRTTKAVLSATLTHADCGDCSQTQVKTDCWSSCCPRCGKPVCCTKTYKTLTSANPCNPIDDVLDDDGPTGTAPPGYSN